MVVVIVVVVVGVVVVVTGSGTIGTVGLGQVGGFAVVQGFIAMLLSQTPVAQVVKETRSIAPLMQWKYWLSL